MTIPTSGGYSSVKTQRGALLEWAEVNQPLELHFEFNPTTISRTRSVTVKTGGAPGTRGGYDFKSKSETPRASQGVTVNAETFSVTILLDATDRMNEGDATACTYGIQPELDVIRTMIEPKSQGTAGARTLAALGEGTERAFSRAQFASVMLFVWGPHMLPVFLTQAQIAVKEFLPSLSPYRAEVTLTMQVIESTNPFYTDELKRQLDSAGRYSTRQGGAGGQLT
jgi:hypothetical protein